VPEKTCDYRAARVKYIQKGRQGGLLFRVEVSVKPDLPDPRGEALKADIRDLGIGGVQQVRVSDVYLLEGKLTSKELELICSQLLADPIVEAYTTGESPLIAPQEARAVEVAYNPGVMDPVEESVSKGIRDLGVKNLKSVKTAKRYYLWGKLSNGDIELISNKLLVNSVIQHVVTDSESVSLPSAEYEFNRVEVELLSLDDAGLTKLGREKLELNLNEMKQIQGYFKKLGRNPPTSSWKRFRRPGQSTASTRPSTPASGWAARLSIIYSKAPS
jgi:phosphoribosylformylglycinamidine (FGAM) synthase PurS component